MDARSCPICVVLQNPLPTYIPLCTSSLICLAQFAERRPKDRHATSFRRKRSRHAVDGCALSFATISVHPCAAQQQWHLPFGALACLHPCAALRSANSVGNSSMLPLADRHLCTISEMCLGPYLTTATMSARDCKDFPHGKADFNLLISCLHAS